MSLIFLSGSTRFPGETAAGALRNKCAFTSRDMGADWPEAFTYAVVMGWDDAMSEVAERHGWDAELVAFLRRTHRNFERLAGKREGGEG